MTAEAAAENKSNFINFINNNQATSPNNNSANMQQSIIPEVNSRTNIHPGSGRKMENTHPNGEPFITSGNTNINDSNNNQNQSSQDLVKQFIQEMSTEL